MFKNLPLWFSQILKKQIFFQWPGRHCYKSSDKQFKMCEKFKKENSGGGESTPCQNPRGGRVIYLVLRGVQLTLNHLLSQKLVESLESVIQKTSCRCARHFENTAYLLIFRMRQTHSRKCRLASFLRKYLIQYPHQTTK